MPARIRRAMNTQTAISSSIGASAISRLTRKLRCWTTGSAVTVTLFLVRSSQSWSSAKVGRSVLNLVYVPSPPGSSWAFFRCPWIASPLAQILLTFPASTCLLNSVYEIVGSSPSLKNDSTRLAIRYTTSAARIRLHLPPRVLRPPGGGFGGSSGVPSVRQGWSADFRGGAGLVISGRYDTRHPSAPAGTREGHPSGEGCPQRRTNGLGAP
jgi:hypothetical protein